MRTHTCLAILATGIVIACGPADPAAESGMAGEAAVPSAAEKYPQPDGAWAVERREFEALMERARQRNLARQPIGDRLTGFGEHFLDLPYVAYTLDLPGPEQLVVNLKELDCVTLVENALALARIAPTGSGFDGFLAELERIRYRGGRLDGYTSRLHYFSDWIRDAERKGLVRDITRELGGVRFQQRIDFMSTHSESYRALRDDPALVDGIRAIEDALNREEWYWIPQERIEEVAPEIREGDIIGITTAIAGLDISHTGLATWRDGRLHLLHAPDVGQPVEISTRPLGERIRANRLQTGIVVARAL